MIYNGILLFNIMIILNRIIIILKLTKTTRQPKHLETNNFILR